MAINTNLKAIQHKLFCCFYLSLYLWTLIFSSNLILRLLSRQSANKIKEAILIQHLSTKLCSLPHITWYSTACSKARNFTILFMYEKSKNLEESTGYSILPSPQRLMWQIHTQRDRWTPSDTIPSPLAVSCVLPHRGRALSDGPTATMEIGVLRLQVLDFGTAFQLICDKLTLALNNLDGY